MILILMMPKDTIRCSSLIFSNILNMRC